ncbi:unnamed protein product [Parajaminaea phylloscopi]
MIRTAVFRASAPLSARTAAVAAPRPFAAVRSFASSASRWSDDHHHQAPILQGDGAKAGEVPSNMQQATGLERFELLGRLQGIDVFDMKPLESHRLGTVKEPITVNSLHPDRVIGCTGSPGGSHDTVWISLNTHKELHRCRECGSVYKLNHMTPPHGEAHH